MRGAPFNIPQMIAVLEKEPERQIVFCGVINCQLYTHVLFIVFFFHTADRTGKNSYSDDIFSGSPVSNRM